MIPKFIVLHHSVSSREKTTIQDVENWHKARWPGFVSSLGFHIGYHYVILGNGKIVQTRKNTELGAHTIPNEGKIGICLTGNFEIEKPSKEQLSSLELLLKGLKRKHYLTNNEIHGHCYFQPTLCPGKNLKNWLKEYKKKDLSSIKKILFLIQEILELLRKVLQLLQHELEK